MNTIHIHATRTNFHKDAALILTVAQKTLTMLKKDGYTLDIFLLRQNMIHALNKQWRGKDAPTNVLSFAERDISMKDLPKKLRDKNYLGEIYISPDFVRKHKQSIEHMAVHGVLHVLGYDHIRELDAKKMERVEQKILTCLK